MRIRMLSSSARLNCKKRSSQSLGYSQRPKPTVAALTPILVEGTAAVVHVRDAIALAQRHVGRVEPILQVAAIKGDRQTPCRGVVSENHVSECIASEL